MTQAADSLERARVAGWDEIAPGVLVRRHEALDVNSTLVLGQERALLVDTRASGDQGRELLAAVRAVTGLEIVVVNTHSHFDHCFGNEAFRDSRIYAHAECAAQLDATAEQQRGDVLAYLREAGYHDQLAGVEATVVTLPQYLVEEEVALDLGGREVLLVPAPAGHTEGMLVVAVPDAAVALWSDLVEVGADPQFDDAYPLAWGSAVAALLAHPVVGAATRAVPGHGAVTDRTEVERQREVLDQLGGVLAAALADGESDAQGLADRAAQAGVPFGSDTLLAAAERALATAD